MDWETTGHSPEADKYEAGDTMAMLGSIRAWSQQVRDESQAMQAESTARLEEIGHTRRTLAATWARSRALIEELRAVRGVSLRLMAESQAQRRHAAGQEGQQQLRARMPGANVLTRDLTARILWEAGLEDEPPCPCRHCRQRRAGRRQAGDSGPGSSHNRGS